MGRPEAIVENYLIKKVESLGGVARKVVYQGRKGAPDRWCLLPGGRLLIVECKASDGRLRQAQAKEISLLEQLGFDVHLVSNVTQVDELLDEVRA